MSKIPVYQPELAGNERLYVNDCLDENWISSKGKYVPLFEDKFCNFVGSKYAVSVSNGTVALHLALEVLGIRPGDEVIVPTLTYIASVNAIKYTGATPVFVDSDINSWQADIHDIEAKITPKTKALMIVHLYGYPTAMDPVMELARKYDLFVVEDCAEAFGAKINGRHVGTYGDLATFSFFGNKTITTGEGGMLVTNDYTLYDRASRLRGQGLAANREYWHDIIGYNYRMTNICAAIGLAQIECADDKLARKQEIVDRYKSGLGHLPLSFQVEEAGFTNSNWMCTVVLQNIGDRDPLREHLGLLGIETRPMFYPVHTMPMYSTQYQRHSTAESLGARGITLPSWPGLQNQQLDFIINGIKTYFN